MFARLHERRQVRREKTSHSRAFFWAIGGSLLLFLGLFLGWWWMQTPTQLYHNILFVQTKIDEQANTIILAQFQGKSTKVTYTVIDGSLPVSVLGGYGTYPVRSVAALLALEKKSPHFLRAAYSHALGIPIDIVVESHDAGMLSVTAIGSLWQRFIWQGWQSVVSLPQRFFLWRQAQAAKTTWTPNQTITDWTAWKKWMKSQESESLPAECGVAVLNATKEAGLASAGAAVLDGGGVPVVRVDDETDAQEKTQMIVAQPSPFCAEVLLRLASIVPFPVSLRVVPDASTQYRADVVLILGDDIANVFEARTGH